MQAVGSYCVYTTRYLADMGRDMSPLDFLGVSPCTRTKAPTSPTRRAKSTKPTSPVAQPKKMPKRWNLG